MKSKYFFATCLISLFSAPFSYAQDYTVLETKLFNPQNKKVLLIGDATRQKKIILFQTTLRVNTDGSPLSYHPHDLRGKNKALNNICNAIAVRKGASGDNLCLKKGHFSEAISVFERFRDSDYQTVPYDYKITWKNVLAATKKEGRDIPCVFQSGVYQGYFGSLTALKNGLTTNKGECQVNDQVNPMTIPALVLAGGENAVRNFGARVGDLLVAYNPNTQLYSSAIIGDTGPANNLGEGSIILNMKLLGTDAPPTNRQETFIGS